MISNTTNGDQLGFKHTAHGTWENGVFFYLKRILNLDSSNIPPNAAIVVNIIAALAPSMLCSPVLVKCPTVKFPGQLSVKLWLIFVLYWVCGQLLTIKTRLDHKIELETFWEVTTSRRNNRVRLGQDGLGWMFTSILISQESNTEKIVAVS